MTEMERTALAVGQTVRVHQKIAEGGKERIQVFEGLIIAVKHGKAINATFTIRKESDGIAVERIFPIHSPVIAKLELARTAKVRRSKLYHVRKVGTRPLREKVVKKKAA